MAERHYLRSIETALDNEDATELSSLVSLNHISHIYALSDASGYRFDQRTLKSLPEPWAELIPAHIACIQPRLLNDPVDLYQCQLTVAQAMLRNCNRTYLPVLFTVLNELRCVAMRADKVLEKRGEKPNKLEDAARTIMRGFNYCITDRAPMEISRKWGVYYVLSLLFKSYIKLKTLNLAKNLLRAVSAAELPPLESFPKSHAVTYQYYLGLYYFWNDEYVAARESLQLAFDRCHKNARKNKSLILAYLLPLNLLIGRFPTPNLLKRHQLTSYAPFLLALKKSELKELDAQLNEYMLNTPSWSVLEQARTIALRGIVKKVWLVLEKPSRLQLSSIQSGFKCVGVDIDGNEVECLVAVLIYRGLVKGYISHEHGIVVLSKGEPFPKLTVAMAQITQ